jgi:hypothetical protein
MSIYANPVPLSSIVPFNTGLQSATEATMISLLGRPRMPLTTEDQPDRASDLVRALEVTDTVAHFRVNGIRPAVKSLQAIFARIEQDEPALAQAVGYSGMLVVRLRRPTSGPPSKKISNHAWGTAIDFHIDGHEPPGDTGQTIPLGIAKLVPYFNKAGWYSGISFHDDMHFEVAEGTIRQWSGDGLLKP